VKEELKDDEWRREGNKRKEGTWDEGVRITPTVLLFHVLNLTLFWVYRFDQCRIHLFAQSASAQCTKKKKKPFMEKRVKNSAVFSVISAAINGAIIG
jgi:hypothetical protein